LANDPDFLLPLPDDDSAPFWQACAKEELRIQRCTSCQRLRMPPRPMCPWCRSWDFEWSEMSGRGRVWSFVIAHPPLLPRYAEVAPYNVAVIELEEDPTIRLVGGIVRSPDSPVGDVDPTTLVIGQPVRVVFGADRGGIRLPMWMPA
jgi:uncharacterized OB-fold protein